MEGEQDKISQSDRLAIKSKIVPLMISLPTSLQVQLSEAVTIIADNDFPLQWENLIPVISFTYLFTNMIGIN